MKKLQVGGHKPRKESKINYTLVDKSDYEVLKKYNLSMNDGYAAIVLYNQKTKKTSKVLIHRFLLNVSDKYNIDHINRNKLDNRRCNLRVATQQQNGFNRGKNKNNTSGFKGVTWSKAAKKWQVAIHLSKKSFYLGLFQNKKDAAKTYNEKAKELFGEFAPGVSDPLNEAID